ncbi:bromodomain-containing protein 8 [Microdochium nivale]|nr:bromodomain-containing protein 8 [Microdochium nivale]
MTNPTVYTNLESLFLFQLLPKHGFLNGAFGRISDELRNTPLIREQVTYDAARLSPEALQELALRLLRDEQRREAELAEKNAAGLSPTLKKRKLQSPPLPSLEDAHRYVDKLPLLVDRLYARYREVIVKEIREDEARIEGIQHEISELEKIAPKDGVVQPQPRIEVVASDPAVPAVPEQKALKPNGPVPSSSSGPPPSTALSKAQDVQKTRAATSSPAPTPAAPLERNPAQNSPSPAPPATVRQPADVRPLPDASKQPVQIRPTTSGSAPAPQHPQAVQAQVPASRPSPTPSKSPLLETSLGPSGPPPATQSPTVAQASQAGQGPATSLQWEPLYQPPPQQTPIATARPPAIDGTPRPQGFPPQTVNGPGQASQATPGPRQTPQQARPASQAHPQQVVPATLPPHVVRPGTPGSQQSSAGPPGDGAAKTPLQQRPQTSGNNVRHPTTGQTPGRFAQPHGPNAALQTPVRPPVPLQAAHPHGSAVKAGGTPNLPRAQTGRPHQAVQPQAPSTPQQHQQAAVKASFGSPYTQHAQLVGGPRAGAPGTHPPQLLPHPSRTPSIPRTPGGSVAPGHVVRGHGTKWVSTPAPATPRMEDVKSYFETTSPAFEPLSPPLPKAQLLKPQPVVQPPVSAAAVSPSRTVPAPELQSKTSEVNTQKDELAATPKPRGRPPRNTPKPAATPSQPAVRPLENPNEIQEAQTQSIKTEAATPRALEEVEETSSSQPTQAMSQPAAGKAVSKRKREESPVTAPRQNPGPATQVLWTRSFHKVSASALEQVISHRYANMFAHAVKERDAPGYRNIVLRPQDLMGIKRAISQGSRAANQAAQLLPDFDSGTSPMNIWLPISADLVPPRGIINIAQLERELVHMFANAIMYAPDPDRGVGPAFKKRRRDGSEDSNEDVLGYEVDEDGIVKDTRSMFGEVEKLLSDLRNEVDRNAPPPTGAAGHSRSMSLAGGEASTAEDDADEQPSDAKRRRVRG